MPVATKTIVPQCTRDVVQFVGLGLLLLGIVALSGCITARGAGSSLAGLSGQPVLVVAEIGPGSPAGEAAPSELEAELIRALALVPLRVWPSDAEPGLEEVLAGAPEGRLARGREAAETRRLPWVLVRAEDSARLETARGGEVLWRTDLAAAQDPNRVLAARLAAALRGRRSADTRSRSLLDPASVRLAPAAELRQLRQLAAAGDWASYREHSRVAAETWPADPSVRTHAGFLPQLDRMMGPGVVPDVGGGTWDDLRFARAVNPDGESELLALALRAEAEDNRVLALHARRLLQSEYGQRLDYLPELTDLVAEYDGVDEALLLCRAGLTVADREGSLAAAPGTAPHDAPLALPFADLAFSTGWYLAQKEAWDLAVLSYEDASQVYDHLGRPKELADALNNAGVALVELGRPLLAARALRRAVTLREGLAVPGRTANARYNLGRALADAGRLEEGQAAYVAAAEAYEAAGSPIEAIETRIELLDLAVRRGSRPALESTAVALLASLAAPAFEGSEADRAAAMTASVWYELGQGRLSFETPSEGLEALTEARLRFRTLGLRLEEGQTLYSMALPHLALLQLTEAHRVLVAALEIAVELSDSTSILAIRSQLGQVEDLLEKAGQGVPELPPDLERWAHPPRAG